LFDNIQVENSKLSNLTQATNNLAKEALGYADHTPTAKRVAAAGKGFNSFVDAAAKKITGKHVGYALGGMAAIGLMLRPNDPEVNINASREAQAVANAAHGIPKGIDAIDPPTARMTHNRPSKYRISAKVDTNRGAAGMGDVVQKLNVMSGSDNVRVHINRDPKMIASRRAKEYIDEDNSNYWNQSKGWFSS